MRRFPIGSPIAGLLVAILAGLAALLAGLAACGEPDEAPADPLAREDSLPLTARALPAGTFSLVSDIGDTLRFRVSPAGETIILARYRRAAGGVDSAVAVIDAESKAPLASFRRIHTADGSVTAELLYGRGFDGQARLTLTAPQGRQEDNIRTPYPALDAAQLPLVLSALHFGAPDTASFNYIASFEKEAFPARLEIGALVSLPGNEPVPAPSGPAAFRVRLRVSGLEERYWLAAEPPHRLLRFEETTRNVTWTLP
ncbi:MAG TPA: hypothetical protein VM737_09460 [Gemmatimonadota bacterium]|nr:hypothetical protein [Gemmatimonadota bacterium]